MPNRKSFNIYLLISFLIIFNSCIPNDLDVKERETSEVSENPIQALENLSIPNGFNFETERDVTLTINAEDQVYEIYREAKIGANGTKVTTVLKENNRVKDGSDVVNIIESL